MSTHTPHIYFLGIGGIGMSALARYFSKRGVRISGYDKTATDLTAELQAEGMNIHFTDSPELIPTDIDYVVYTPAIPSDQKELLEIKRRGLTLKKRAQVLGDISRTTRCLAVAGTHGKTTTSTLLTHLLRESEIDVTAFVGGISANYNTNYLIGNSDVMVAEADEYDRSFLQLSPQGIIITSCDPDHLDIYGSGDQVHSSFNELIRTQHNLQTLNLHTCFSVIHRSFSLEQFIDNLLTNTCLLYTSPSPRDLSTSRMPSSA